ncbi:MAG: alpha-ketoglutarate-dependent dioxygenase AlkB [Sediminicola sp.]
MQDPLSAKNRLDLPDAEILYYPHFLMHDEADGLFTALLENVPWQQDLITIFGKTHPQPRLTALYGNNSKTYSYSNIRMRPHPFTKELLALKKKTEEIARTGFSSCLLNLYRDGRDSNGWHADNEKELGTDPIIASISLGQERYFHLKHRTCKEERHKLLLQHGSLLLMKGSTQHHWLHQIPKTAKPLRKRINLTFRNIL